MVTHRWPRMRSEDAFVDAIEEELGSSVVRVEDGWPEPASFAGVDAVVVFIRFRELASSAPIEWGRFGGLRLMVDHDAYLNYVDVAPSHHRGRWPEVFRHHRFDALVTSGRDVSQRLVADGVPAIWLPKGYDDRYFRDLGGHRTGYCTYGSRYRARAAMARRLSRAEITYEQLDVEYGRLGEKLNGYAGCFVCNMQGTPILGGLGRGLNRLVPGALVRTAPGIEPMIKNFEAAAAGCAVFADHIPELSDLGFVDGENFVEYRSFDELVCKANTIDEVRLREIGRAGAALCRSRHTWRHRALQLAAIMSECSK